MEIEIDFSNIFDMESFYTVLKAKVELPEHFGENLDALNDVISGDWEMPLELNFTNLSLLQLESFEELIDMLDELTMEVEGFEFAYFIKDVDDL